MAEFEGQEMAVARVYAGAMLELAEARNETAQLQTELLELAERVDTNPDFARFLSSPLVDAKARRAALEKLFRGRYSDLLVDSLQVLNRKDRLGLIRAVAEAFRLDYEDARGRLEVHVRTAVPLPDELRGRIKTVAKEKTGKDVDLVETVDDSLIGGLVMRIGDEKFDASVATRLKTIGAALLERASHEIHGGRSYLEGTAT
ncbi:MAG: ATP synthase F1 subunit delta [Phycisphaerae bacterium]|jgi:F-type H+-transporting ATPase subunit delta